MILLTYFSSSPTPAFGVWVIKCRTAYERVVHLKNQDVTVAGAGFDKEGYDTSLAALDEAEKNFLTVFNNRFPEKLDAYHSPAPTSVDMGNQLKGFGDAQKEHGAELKEILKTLTAIKEVSASENSMALASEVQKLTENMAVLSESVKRLLETVGSYPDGGGTLVGELGKLSESS